MTRAMSCQALDGNRRRCRSKERLVAVNYLGSDVHYGFCADTPEPPWVRVYLCPKHRKPRVSRSAE